LSYTSQIQTTTKHKHYLMHAMECSEKQNNIPLCFGYMVLNTDVESRYYSPAPTPALLVDKKVTNHKIYP